MKKILNSTQMKACDAYTTEYFGVPSIVLMERAALAVCDAMVAYCGLEKTKKVLVICGTGNNGADGLALARILYENNIPVSYYVPFNNGKCSSLFETQKGILEKYGATEIKSEKIMTVADLEEFDVIVDALFGIGLSRNLDEKMCQFIERVNNARAIRTAVDVPSGINSDTGAIMGEAFKADITVTFGFAKAGMMLYPGRKYTGKLVLAQIGITEKSLKEVDTYLYEETDVIKTLPKRPDDGNKGTFGKVLIFAGSPEMTGACVMASRAAFRSGAGMVRIMTCEENRILIQTTIPEAMMTPLSNMSSEEDLRATISDAVNWADVILAGPGIGTKEEVTNILKLLIEIAGEKKLVLDADALNIVAKDDEVRQKVLERAGLTVLTPHVGELSRLANTSINSIKEDFLSATAKLADNYNSIIVAKDAITCVSNGKQKVLISSGNNGMATAGSGDVLAGIVAAFLAFDSKHISEDELEKAVMNAAYIHGMAGTECLKKLPEDSIMASDVTAMLPTVLSKIRIEQVCE